MKQPTVISQYSVYALVVFAGMLLSACGSKSPYGGSDQPKNIKIGKPYSVKGEDYVPKYDPSYNKEGMASWYGPGFHGRMTASGEEYDENELTAAHATLPLPSIARVTLLKTGKSILVRINDRGPFSSKRIIDLSKGSAKEIGLIKYGVSRVRVEYLPEETEEYLIASGIPVPDYMKQRKAVTHAEVVSIKRSKFEANGEYVNPEPKQVQEKPSFFASLFGGGTKKRPDKVNYSSNAASAPLDVSYQPMRRDVPLETVDAAAVDAITVADTAPVEVMSVQNLPPVESAKNIPSSSSTMSKDDAVRVVTSSKHVPATPSVTAKLRMPEENKSDAILTNSNKALSAPRLASSPFKAEKISDAKLVDVAMSKTPSLSFAIKDSTLNLNKPTVSAKVDATALQEARDGTFLIQAGSFSERENARKQADALAEIAKAEIREASVSGLTIYRVVVGPVGSKDAADKLHDQVVAKGFADARVIGN